MRIRSILVAAVLASSAFAAHGGEALHVRAELVTDATELEPGETVRVGVRLVMDEGWHVYWTNPGDAGLPTEVTWQVPDGVEVRELTWPVPDSFDSPGGIASYGYGGEVVLPFALAVAPDAGGPMPIRATVGWLACRERCVLGDVTVEASLPVSADEAARGGTLLDAALAAAPVAEHGATFDLQSVTRVPVTERSGALVAWVSWAEPPAGEVVWYPDAAPGLKVEGVTTRTRGSLTRIDAKVTVMDDGAPAAVPSVLVVDRPDGQRTGWRIDVPVRDISD